MRPDSEDESLLLRVNITSDDRVTSTAGKFASVQKKNRSDKEHCISLYVSSGDDEANHIDNIDFLSLWSVPVNAETDEGRDILADRLLVA
jgi:hypothetical protein